MIRQYIKELNDKSKLLNDKISSLFDTDLNKAKEVFKEYLDLVKKREFVQHELKRRYKLEPNDILYYFNNKLDYDIPEKDQKEIIELAKKYDYSKSYDFTIVNEKDINKLKNKATEKDLENLKVVEKFFEKSDGLTNDLSKESEFFGNLFGKKYKDLKQNAKKNSKYNISIPVLLNYDVYDLSNKFNPDSIGEDVLNEIRNSELKISKTFSEKLIDVLKDMDEIFPKEFDNNGNINENVKIDSQFSIMRSKAKKYIEDGDLKSIDNLVNSSNKLSSKTLALRKKIENLTKSTFIPPNASSSRENSIPYSERMDYVNGSKINNLCYLLDFSRLTNISIEEVVRNPLKAIREGYKKYNENYIKYIVNKDMNETAKNIFSLSDEITAPIDARISNFQTVVERVLESLPMLDDGITEKEREENIIKCDLYQKLFISPIKLNTVSLFELNDDEKSILISNLLVVKPEDRDLIKLNPSSKNRDENTLKNGEQGYKFDQAKYVSEHVNEMDLTLKVLDYERAFEYYKTVTDNASDIIKSYADNLLYCIKNANSKTKYQDLEIFANNPQEYKNTNSYKKCVAYQEFKENISENNIDVNKTLKSLSNMEKIRKERFFLARWFTSSGKKDRNQINELKEKLATKLNVNKDVITSWIKADHNNDEKSKNQILKSIQIDEVTEVKNLNQGTPIIIKELAPEKNESIKTIDSKDLKLKKEDLEIEPQYKK